MRTFRALGEAMVFVFVGTAAWADGFWFVFHLYRLKAQKAPVTVRTTIVMVS